MLLNIVLKKSFCVAPQCVRQIAAAEVRRTIHTARIASCRVQNQPTVEGDETRVYYGTLTPQIRAVKVFSLTTSAVGIAAQPVLYEQASKLGTSTPVIVGICGFIGFFTFITPLLIHIIASKYVTEMHYNSKTEEYRATIISFFMTKKQLRFKKEDVVVPEVSGMFTSFLVRPKGSSKLQALFVDPRLFDDTIHYIKLMGYDKPIDFKLNLTEDEHKRLSQKKSN